MTQTYEEPRTLRLLLVDDDLVDRKSIRRALVAGGVHAELLEASDAQEALALIMANRFDAVFLDFNMPGHDGLWLVKQLRYQGSRCPLIVLTGQGDEQIAVELMKAGATDYVTKSTFTPERATQNLRHALRVAQVEAALRASEERAQLAIEATQLGTWDMDPVTGELQVSPRCRELLCVGPHEEATYDRCLSNLRPEDRIATEAAVARALEPESSGAYDIEYRVVSSDGESEHWVHATGRAFFDEFGKAVRFIGTVQDISEQKQSEARRTQLLQAERAAREQAEATTRMRDELSAIVSHDLRNPLASIRMTAETAQLVGPPYPDTGITKSLRAIVHLADRMDRLIADLLDVATIEGGRLSIRPARHGAANLMREAEEMMALMATDKSLRLQVGPPPSTLDVVVDKERVLQVFSNLIGNAIKFTPEGGRIVLTAREEADYVTFSVTDNGQGLSEEHLQHVFDRYWQAKKARRLGIGLGLSIAKGVVEAHHGKIWAESTLGAGTTFHFTLPKHREPVLERVKTDPSLKPVG